MAQRAPRVLHIFLVHVTSVSLLVRLGSMYRSHGADTELQLF